MAHLWTPDTCKNGACLLDVVDGHAGINAVVRVCGHHAAIRSGLTDAAFFARVLETNRAKNYACHEVAGLRGLGIHEIAWFVDDDDLVRINGGGVDRAEARAAIARRPEIRTGKVIIE